MSTHHTIDYIEIGVTDLDVAKAVYASAFGWSFADLASIHRFGGRVCPVGEVK
jgi:predicted enzyme related to lactoylglutathione lyase